MGDFEGFILVSKRARIFGEQSSEKIHHGENSTNSTIGGRTKVKEFI